MIQAEDFISQAISRGYTFFTGVPCSLLTSFINYVIQDKALDYVGASSEGEALGIAAGAYLAGRKAVVMCQNSGFGNMVNPVVSLTFPFRIPVLLIVTLRGEPGINDEPQHELMGQITGSMLDVLRIPWAYFPDSKEAASGAMNDAEEKISATGMPYAFIMKKGMVAKTSLPPNISNNANNRNVMPEGEFDCPPAGRMQRMNAIKSTLSMVSDKDAVITTTGKIGRELYTLKDTNNHLYVVGSMGCASGIGFGIQYIRPEQRVFVLDGDGAALMKMGTLATIGHYRPSKLIHIIFDNEAHESTGGQPTVSDTVDFSAVASACGYRACYRADNISGLENAISATIEKQGPALIHVKVACESSDGLGRPVLKPFEVKERFMQFLQTNTL